MAGIYFHIPFCKQACHYCDFHFNTSLRYKEEMLDAMLREIRLRATYLNTQEINTIYFGGGTPSLLEGHEINILMDELARHYNISGTSEITIEANPDDLDNKKIAALKHTPINRFSIGIQSFFEEDLKWMNRAHNATEADGAIKRIQDAGFENITADLIYGYPLLTDEKWSKNIHQLIQLQIPHVSAYSITVEPRTALAHFVRSGKQKAMDEEQSATQFLLLSDIMGRFSYDHYEISNFAIPNHYAIHNTNYWKSEPYIGIGPSAHSFDGNRRQWNINNNAQYISSILKNSIPAKIEVLSNIDKINEYIMTSLRTMWGLDLNYIEQLYGSIYSKSIEKRAQSFEREQQLLKDDHHLKLTVAGKLFADSIAASLFIDEE